LEEYVKRESDEPLDEAQLREAEDYLNSPAATVLGATPEARQLVRRSRAILEDTKRRQAEELEEARQRAQQQEQVVRLLRRQRVFGVIVLVLGVIILLVLGALGYVMNEKRKLWKQTATRLEKERQAQAEQARKLTVNAKTLLKNGKDDPIRDVTALRNVAGALKFNPQDIEAAQTARNLLLRRIWCPPAAPEVRYEHDTLLAAAFAPGGSNNEVFTIAGDGQLLFWNGGPKVAAAQSLFRKPKVDPLDFQHVVQNGFASFSPNGQWLFVVPPTLASTGGAEAAGQVPPLQGGGGAGSGATGYDNCKLQIWRWSQEKRTYQSAGEHLEFRRLRGSRMINFSWSPESDRVVLVNTTRNEVECTFFKLKGNTFEGLINESNTLKSMNLVALAFTARHAEDVAGDSIPGYEGRNAIAAVLMDFATPGQCQVKVIDADNFTLIPEAIKGEDSKLLLAGFQPNSVAFGPANDQLTLTSWSGVQTLDLRDGDVKTFSPPTFRDQFMRIVAGPRYKGTRLVAQSLYGRIEMAEPTLSGEVSKRQQYPVEPVVFRGSIGIPQFSPDGQRMLIVSGGIWNVFDRMRLIDVSRLYQTQQAVPETFEEKAAPPWLADIASAVSTLDTTGDGGFLTLQAVREKNPGSKSGDPYEAVWNHFFPK
jgi:hypothetical protein